MTAEIQWKCLSFSELSTDQLFEIMKLRVDVFVVEQQCPYPELDDKDRLASTRHLCGYSDGQLAVYARLLDLDVSYSDCLSIGRVIVAQPFRALKLGNQLIAKGVEELYTAHGRHDIQIGAQAHLERFYASHGFERNSADYLEDDIPHLDMILRL